MTENEWMNAAQDQGGLISDNCVTYADVASRDRMQARAILGDITQPTQPNPTKPNENHP